MAKDCPLLHLIVNREQFIADHIKDKRSLAKQFIRRKKQISEIDRYQVMKDCFNRLQSRMENGSLKLMKSPQTGQEQPVRQSKFLVKKPWKERYDSYESHSAQNQSLVSGSNFSRSELPENIEGFEEQHSLPVLVRSLVSPQINVPISSERHSRFSRQNSLSNLKAYGNSRSVCLSAEPASEKLNEKLRRKSDSGADKILKGKVPTSKLMAKLRAITKLTHFGTKKEKVIKPFEMDIDKICNFTYYFPHNNFSSLFPYSHAFDHDISPLMKYSSIYDTVKDV